MIDLAGTPAGSGSIPAIPAGSAFTPTDPALFSSAARLSLLAPVGQGYLDSLLPESLRNSSTPFLMDAWLEQQALKQAALRETGQATFIAGLAYDEASGLGVDAQQRALLYQAAARFASAEEIRLGVALSEDQQARLSEPMLWYVEESVSGPDGKAYAALSPRLYLPQGQLGQWANVAGGVIRGVDVTLDAGAERIENTGYVVAGNTLAVDAGELVNRARSAAWGSFTMDVEGGLLEVWGDRVQPGGFLSAAKLDLNVGRVESISGEFLEGGADSSGDLARSLGSDFSRSVNRDNTHTLFHADESIGLEQLVIMVVAIAVSIYTAGAASEALYWGMAESGLASTTSIATLETLAAAGAGAAGAMAGNAAAQVLATGDLDVGNVLRSGLAGGLSGGVAGYYGSTYGVERLLAETATGCAAALISGDSCGSGMKSALVTTSLAWANREMRNAMIEESKLSPGICDEAGNCLSNDTGMSTGVEGDMKKVAGGRLDFNELCAQELCAQDESTKKWLRDEQGRIIFKGGSYTFEDGRVFEVTSLSDYIAIRPELRSPMGGLQGSTGLFAVFDYAPGSFWDRVAESFAGPHDLLNSSTWYGPDGNIRSGITGAAETIGNITNYLNVLPAAPFAGASLIPRGTIQAIESGLRNEENNSSGAAP